MILELKSKEKLEVKRQMGREKRDTQGHRAMVSDALE